MRKQLLLSLLCLVYGCSAPSTMLVNDEGQLYRCAAGGQALAGVQLADSNQSNCVSDFKKVGYFEIPIGQIGVAIDFEAVPPRVSSVSLDSPAARAGLAEGDVIISIDGYAVPTLRKLYEVLGRKVPGDSVAIHIERLTDLLYAELQAL